MSEQDRKPGANAQRSFGEELRRERELRQISLREVAEATKINLRFLEALENNDFDALPGGFFTRGFIKSYARHIGLNEEAMVNAFLMELTQQRRRALPEPPVLLEQPAEAPAPARGPGRGVRSITAGASLLAFFGLAFLLWTGVRQMGEEAAASRSNSPTPEIPAAVPEAAAAQAEPAANETEVYSPAPDPEPEPIREPAPPPERQSPPESLPPPERASPPERLEVQLTFTGRTWIRVLCDNHEAINRTLDEGTLRRLNCLEEVALSTTDAGAVQVEINGLRIELPGGPGDRVLPYVVRREDWPPEGVGANEVDR